MIPTNVSRRQTQPNPTIYPIYFTQNVINEIERICSLNFCNMTIPYKTWKEYYFYGTVQWIREIFDTFSWLTYGYVGASSLLANSTYIYVSNLLEITYQFIRQETGETIIVVLYAKFKTYNYKNTPILMECRKKVITESQLRIIIRESLHKILQLN